MNHSSRSSLKALRNPFKVGISSICSALQESATRLGRCWFCCCFWLPVQLHCFASCVPSFVFAPSITCWRFKEVFSQRANSCRNLARIKEMRHISEERRLISIHLQRVKFSLNAWKCKMICSFYSYCCSLNQLWVRNWLIMGKILNWSLKRSLCVYEDIRAEGCLQLCVKCLNSKQFLDFELHCDLCIVLVFIERIEHIY